MNKRPARQHVLQPLRGDAGSWPDGIGEDQVSGQEGGQLVGHDDPHGLQSWPRPRPVGEDVRQPRLTHTPTRARAFVRVHTKIKRGPLCISFQGVSAFVPFSVPPSLCPPTPPRPSSRKSRPSTLFTLSLSLHPFLPSSTGPYCPPPLSVMTLCVIPGDLHGRGGVDLSGRQEEDQGQQLAGPALCTAAFQSPAFRGTVQR